LVRWAFFLSSCLGIALRVFVQSDRALLFVFFAENMMIVETKSQALMYVYDILLMSVLSDSHFFGMQMSFIA
jgi:hypothetical protein